MSHGDEWDVRITDDAVVVELPRQLVLDTGAGERLYTAFRAAVSDADVDRVVSIVAVEHPLSEEFHRMIRTGARVAADNGITEWHVVAEHESKGVAIAREIPGLDTAVFDDEGTVLQTPI